MAPNYGSYLEKAHDVLKQAGLGDEFTYHGALDRQGKLDFLRSLDVLSVPATYDEPKGMFLLESMAAGVPVVQPRRGAFTEVVEKTGGGLLVAPDDVDAVADGTPSTVVRSRTVRDAGGSSVRRRARSLHDRAVGGSSDRGVRVGGSSRQAGLPC